MKYIALCDSEDCAFERVKIGTTKRKGRTYSRVEPKYTGAKVKNVKRDTFSCPDCNSALFWKLNPKETA